ncbi:hypothetical protein GSS88_01940 [Corynebacterium sp. 3HC-13]|uniref:globin domain-containing protein n=1 Tax=Corynebacterium poyangense TaxID=2684405 RepID=UPI001CD0189B|nr:globin domain-containing protein [Corynebacterium poyangense]MBZ8176560.1 hypothetical protein [Corynebacterium poyangense]
MTSDEQQPLKDVAEQLRARANEFNHAAHELFFPRAPQARTLFPRTSRRHEGLVATLADVLDRSTTTIPPHVREYLAGHGRRHRRHGFPPEAYSDFAHALVEALHRNVLDANLAPGRLAQGADILRQACQVMADAAAEADYAGVPPAWAATVVDTEKRSRRLSVIRLESGMPFSYLPGQHLPVSTDYLAGTWKMLSPAVPATESGQVEFHILSPGKGRPGALLAHARKGDLWTLGAAEGHLCLGPSLAPGNRRDLLLLAAGTGLAPLRAMVLGLLEEDNPPSVDIVHVAQYPGELYDVVFFENLATALPWFRFHLATQEEADPWWLHSAITPPASVSLMHAANLGEYALSLGEWSGREVYLAGPAREIYPAASSLYRSNQNFADITYEAW